MLFIQLQHTYLAPTISRNINLKLHFAIGNAYTHKKKNEKPVESDII